MIPKSKIAAFLMSAALMASLNVNAESIEVQKFKYAGPYPVSVPWMADSVNVKAEKYSMDGVLDSPLNLSVLNQAKTVSVLPNGGQDALHLSSFTFTNTSRTKVTIAVNGLKDYRLFVDGEPVKANGGKSEMTLMPSNHTVVIKYLTTKLSPSSSSSNSDGTTSVNAGPCHVSVTAEDGKAVTIGETSSSAKRAYNIYDVMQIPTCPGVSIVRHGLTIKAIIM